MRSIAQQSLTLVQRFVHQRHITLLQVAQTTVNQLAAL